MRDSDLIGVKATLVALLLFGGSVGAFFIAPVAGVIVVGLCAVSLALYLGYKAVQKQEIDD